ncbi:MAG TPA: D-alanyl-D-alanine carboxypeptidase [Steroidobacteraceae bacterium]|nr:D-alanyl-D-alanine carboxypeptidase [Steroidobacteraceae bacterium]
MRYFVIPILAFLSASAAWSGESQGLATAARSILGPGQGVYVETADGTVLVAQAASVAVHPASVSKVPTTLALLRKFGPDHRFVTTFAGSGHIFDGTLYGDLSVESDGDPSLVDEDALLVAERLKSLGIHRVVGALRLRDPLTFDWQPDGTGNSLRRALSGQTPAAAWQAVRELGAADPAPTPGILFSASVTTLPPTPAPGTRVIELVDRQPLVIYRSQPLVSLAKSLNDYSNNIFKPFADAAGGAAAVESLARSAVPRDMSGEIVLGDGAGTDPANRLSPRAAVRLLRALEQELATTGHMLFDILPVAGVDAGTLHDRLNGPSEAGRVVGKTGTFGDYGASALIGAIHTTDRGTVYFAILNHDVPVPQARLRQDRFVRVLLAKLHSAPWSYERDLRPAVARAEVLIAPRERTAGTPAACPAGC